MQRTPQKWLTLIQAQQDSVLSVKKVFLERGMSTSNSYKHKVIIKPEISIATS